MAPSGLSGFVNRTKRILSRESHQGGQTVEQHPQGLEVVSEGNNPVVEYAPSTSPLLLNLHHY